MSIRGRLLVGREDELERARLALGLGRAADRTGGLLLLSGDAGIGKTSVVTRLADTSLADDSCRVLVGHCVGGAGTALPYLPFVEIFGRLDEAEPETVDRLLSTHGALARLLPRRARSTEASSDSDKGRLLEAVHGAVQDLARDGRLLLVVEDLHWADESSRDLLTFLFTRSFAGPLSLVATYRSDDLHRRHPLRASLAVWARLPEVARLELGPLTDDAVADIVRSQTEDLPAQAVDAVVRKAEGNAFFAEELASAAAHGVAGDAQDLSQLLLSRVELLDDASQEVVRVAAVVGRRVPQRLLERVSGLEGLELERHIRSAVEHHVLEPSGSDAYMFRHALLAEAVYEDLLPSERLRLHRVCSAALQEDPSLGTAADLARHARAAGETAVAVRACLHAGDAALAVGGPAEALTHYETGLELLTDDDGSGQRLTIGAAEAALSLGRTGRAVSLLQARLDDESVRGADRAELLGHLAYILRLTENTVDLDPITAEAVELLEGATAAQRVYVLTRRLEHLLDADRLDEAATACQAAMAAAEADPASSHIDLMTNVARLREQSGDPAEMIRRLTALVAGSDLRDLPAVRVLHNIGRAHYTQENLQAALDAYLLATDRAREVGLAWAPFGLDAAVMAVTAAYELGQWDRALEIVERCGVEAPPFAQAALDAAAALVHAGRGDDRAIVWLPRLRKFWGHDGLHAIQSGAAGIDAFGFAGDLAAAVALRTEVVDYVRALWMMDDVAGEVRLAALLLGQLADHLDTMPTPQHEAYLADATRLYEGACRVFGPETRRPAPNTEGRAWLARLHAEYERLLWRAGHPVDLAVLRDVLQDAVELFEARGDPYEAVRSRLRLAEVLALSGDRETAAALAQDVRVVAARLGAAPLASRVDSLLGPRRPPAHGLTARELEVLGLLAAGRSNGQIGTALFISTKTASVHVSNILAKLGAASRGEAAAIARDRGLLS